MFRESLSEMTDEKVLERLQDLVLEERKNLITILHHLREVERRKLFSDLGYQSLFDYAVKELKYGEGQAGRRIQAMRLLKELPQMEEKIQSGTLSLTNISQAQACFRELKGVVPDGLVLREGKLKILESLENQSSREGKRRLLKIQEMVLGDTPIVKESERIVSSEHIEMKFLISCDLKRKLDVYRALLGPKSYKTSFAEMIEHMVDVAIRAFERDKFGRTATPAPESPPAKNSRVQNQSEVRSGPKVPPNSKPTRPSRYIGKNLKALIWARDQGRCVNCAGQMNLQYDHIHPIALGGVTKAENLRLLCHHCNQRAGIKAGLVHPR